VKSDTQSWLGIVARNCLFTRSIGHGRASSVARKAICIANLPRGGPNVTHEPFDRAACQIMPLAKHRSTTSSHTYRTAPPIKTEPAPTAQPAGPAQHNASWPCSLLGSTYRPGFCNAYPYTLAPSTSPNGSACIYHPVDGSKGHMSV